MSAEIKDGFVRMYHKKNKVWAELAADGIALAEQNGKVKIKYQLSQSHEYLVPTSSLRTLDEGADPHAETTPKKKASPAEGENALKKTAVKPLHDSQPSTLNSQLPKNAILMYTDGASSGNPGPSGIGVYLQYGEHTREISEYIGIATNNIAELTAIQRGLEAVKNKKLPVRILTDSQYVLGLLTLNWKAQKNQEIVAAIKKLMCDFNDLKLIKVKGHQGVAGNEKADQLAVAAIKNAPKA